jgi:hypothetical protein
MPPLLDEPRRQLEKAVTAARDKAEEGALAALRRLFVDNADSKSLPPGMTGAQRALRVQLRAHARQLGDQVPEKGPQRIERLTAECAYEFWHRMLFARYLAENHLLIHPDHNVAMSLEDCRELAEEEGSDPWDLAARCASRMLPEIFRPGDPLLQVPFAPEHKLALEEILSGLPAETFTADDSLGWVYQFWQAKRKDEVNASEVKIGGDELPAVTQLFTEPYMVQFLLHNTLGAWWVSRQAAQRGCKPAEVSLPGYAFDYLRFRDDGTPAAGAFPGWPDQAAELKVLDPCCGSGHFLVAAFGILVRIRMHDDGLSAREACDAVLRDNLFGLELDARCTQIAAFNLALAAWKFPNAGGYRPLPQMHIACSGQAPKGKREEWLKLAVGDKRLRVGMDLLYDLFREADELGSLINPRKLKVAEGIGGNFSEVKPLLQQILEREEVNRDAELHETGVTAQGIARAAEMLAGQYHLVTTNVPYLAIRRQHQSLRAHLSKHYHSARFDLATALFERCIHFLIASGSAALVVPLGWTFLKSYESFRRRLLQEYSWLILARLGPGAFGSITGEVVNPILVVISNVAPLEEQSVAALDSSASPSPGRKAICLQTGPCSQFSQMGQLSNPEARVSSEDRAVGKLLESYAVCLQGNSTGDSCRFQRCFWEVQEFGERWSFQQGTVTGTRHFGGCEGILLWDKGLDIGEDTEREGMRFPRDRMGLL